jgi:hypothetical protein
MKTTFDEELLTALKWEDNLCNVAQYDNQFSSLAIVYGRESKAFTIIHEVKSSKEPEVMFLSKENMEKIVNFYNTL